MDTEKNTPKVGKPYNPETITIQRATFIVMLSYCALITVLFLFHSNIYQENQKNQENPTYEESIEKYFDEANHLTREEFVSKIINGEKVGKSEFAYQGVVAAHNNSFTFQESAFLLFFENLKRKELLQFNQLEDGVIKKIIEENLNYDK